MADVGPDRAAAEWILRLGGSVKFGSFESWTTDYNRMPAEPRETTRLEAINASGISITNNGLEHLGTVRMALKTWEDPKMCQKLVGAVMSSTRTAKNCINTTLVLVGIF